MTRLAKAPSAFTPGRHSGRFTVLALAMACALLLANVTGASAEKYYDSTIGTQSASTTGVPPTPAGTNFGGFFSSSGAGVGDVTVNDSSIVTDGTGQSGYVYVVDRGNNRIQAFDSLGAFKWAIGRDVVAPSVNEAQVLSVSATAGKYKLEFNGETATTVSVELDWNASAATVDNALDALVENVDGNVIVTGTAANGTTVPVGRYAIQFAGAKYGSSNRPQVTVLPGAPPLTGSASVQTIANGSATPGAGDTSERQSVMIGGSPSGGSFTLTFGANTTAAIPFNASAAEVDSALEAIASVGAGNVEVTGSAGGPYAVEFTGTKRSVDQAQMTASAAGLTPSGTVTVATTQDGASFEKCTVAGQCKAGVNTAPANAALGNGGTFNGAMGIDINQTTGAFFVREANSNSRVQQFTADGQFIRTFGWDVRLDTPVGTTAFETCNAATGDICKAGVAGAATGTTNPGQFGSSTTTSNGLAVAPPNAPNAGQVYVADPGNLRVQRFTVPASSTGAVSVGTPFGTATEFAISAPPGTNWPRDIAADSNGIVYASAVGGGSPTNTDAQINRFDTNFNSFVEQISPNLDDNFFDRGIITNLEIDHSTDHLLTARAPGPATDGPAFAPGILELDVSENPPVVDISHLVEVGTQGLGVYGESSPSALGIGDGRYFLPTSTTAGGTGSGHRVLVLDADGVDPDPIVMVDPVTDATATTATFEANIDPVLTSGFQTSYRWQLSKDGVNWEDATASQVVPPNGFTKSDVTHSATGLEPNVLYRVRIRTDRSPAAGFSFSAAQLFSTDPAPPIAETRPAQMVSDASARLVGNLNPGGLPTTYWFEWGEDMGYGSLIPVPAANANGGLDRLVVETLADLEPQGTYHYRLCAQNSLSPSKVCGADVGFQTRAAATAPPGRSLEMVTSPDKVLRRGGAHGTGSETTRFPAGLPSTEGDSLLWAIYAGISDPESEPGYSYDYGFEVRRRTTTGWHGEAVVNVPPPFGGNAATSVLSAASADVNTQAWAMRVPMFASGYGTATRVMGDTGGPRGAGWYPWLDSAWTTASAFIVDDLGAQIDDEGERMVGWNLERGNQITPADDIVSPNQLTPPQTSGKSLFLTDPAHDWRPADFVNECTGSGVSSTLIPTRHDAGTDPGPPGTWQFYASFPSGSTVLTIDFLAEGTPAVGHEVTGPGIQPDTNIVAVGSETITISKATTEAAASEAFTHLLKGGQDSDRLTDDTIETRQCGEGSPTDVRGAVLGGAAQTGNRLEGTRAMALSDDGNRIFFLSPDPVTGGSGLDSCASGVGSATACPPQLYVRQYADDGEPTVRWISRAQGIGTQKIGEFGNGASFEGASRDGSVVYFRTNAPLTPDDPNGGNSITEGVASAKSWDLYRYELPADNSIDPATGVLTRVSAGPDPVGAPADPNTNCTSSAANCGASNGGGSAMRFLSDDGERAYFVTAAQIPTADNAAPAGGATAPTAANAQVNDQTRNLYLYDASKSGAAAYQFIALIPFSRGDLDACASNAPSGGVSGRTVAGEALRSSNASCFHGTSSGDAVVFESTAQLTADDSDAAGDVFLYDAELDELVRLSAPPVEGEPYTCVTDNNAAVLARCNADLGISTEAASGAQAGFPKGSGVGQAGMRNHNLTENPDGTLKAVYFESRLPLLDADVNGDRMDVYEWRPDGRLSLVSPGNGPHSAFFTGTSRSGSDVFFWTEQRISPWEVDEVDGDVYNSTTRDSLPGPPALPPVCDVLGGSCQPPPGPAPGASSVSSSVLKGEGNVTEQPRRKPRRCAKGKVRKGKKCVVRKSKNPKRTNQTRRASR